MPVVVTLRDGEKVEFMDAVAYEMDGAELRILAPTGLLEYYVNHGGSVGAPRKDGHMEVGVFNAQAWQYAVVVAPPQHSTPSELLRDWLEQGSDGVPKTIRVSGVDVPLERMELREVDGIKYVHVHLYSRIEADGPEKATAHINLKAPTYNIQADNTQRAFDEAQRTKARRAGL